MSLQANGRRFDRRNAHAQRDKLDSVEEEAVDAQQLTRLEVGGQMFDLMGELGRGAHAVVFEAEAVGGARVALKCSRAANSTEFRAAVAECHLLERLTEDLCVSPGRHHVPHYITHSVDAAAQTVVLVMDKSQGLQVDHWLYGVSDEQLLSIDVDQFLDGQLPNGSIASRGLESAARAAGDMLQQLAPVLGALEQFAFHRDISLRNLLVTSHSSDELSFTLLDFGYSIADLAGDPRYWSLACWALFAYGPDHFDLFPDTGFREMHEKRTDIYALGTTILEVFFALWDEDYRFDPPVFAAARVAWRLYWGTVYRLFQRFHADKASSFTIFRGEIRETDDLPCLLRAHSVLLRGLRKPCECNDSTPARLLAVAADMLDPHNNSGWQQLLNHLG